VKVVEQLVQVTFQKLSNNKKNKTAFIAVFFLLIF